MGNFELKKIQKIRDDNKRKRIDNPFRAKHLKSVAFVFKS